MTIKSIPKKKFLDRDGRSAAALRENLRRRKKQSEGRASLTDKSLKSNNKVSK